MSYTAGEVIDLAVLRSQLNDRGLVDVTVLLKSMSSYERRVYIRAAMISPEWAGTSGDTTVRATYTAGWNIGSTPGNIAAVTKLVVKTIAGTVSGVNVGDKLNLVTSRFPESELAPRAYIRDRQVFGYGTELGAADANMVTALTVYYAKVPAAMTSESALISVPDEWIDLLVLPIAKLMCLRDRRPDDASIIDAELTDLMSMFEAGVLIYDQGASRPLPSIPALPAPPPGKNA